MNAPDSRPRAFPDDPNTPPPDDWVSLAIACLVCIVLVAFVVSICLAWPLL